jgi:PhnB protein
MVHQNSKNGVRTVPEGFHTVTPFLVVENAAGLIEFIEKAFGGKQTFNMKMDDGKIMHATVTVGDSTIMICDRMDESHAHNAMLYLYVDDVDAMYKKALAQNATKIHEPTKEFYGDKAGAIKDPWGNTWWIATHVEDVDTEELDRRSKIVLEEQKERRQEVHS